MLCCAQCGRDAADDSRGWRALHGREHPEDQPDTIVFCPEWAREFAADDVATTTG